jgi:hypothetical protein
MLISSGHYLYAMPRIRFLERKEIAIDRWDRCVRESTHTDIYALSGWLDIMSEHWSGLVQDDYAAVLPITWNQKYFLHYIYTPRFTSPLPLCGEPGNIMPLQAFLECIPRKFVLWDLDIQSPQANEVPNFSHRHRTNHLLSLAKKHDELFSGYRPGYRNLIRKAAITCSVHNTSDYANIIQKAASKKEIKGMKPLHYQRFTRLCQWLEGLGMLESWEVLSQQGERIAGAVFAKNNRKIYYLLAWNNEKGRSAAASHLLMDQIIEAHAGSEMVLDFEGSDHPDIAHFMRGFGADLKAYLHISKRPFT